VLATVRAPCLASTSADTGRGGQGWSGRSTGQVGPALKVPNTPVPAGGDGGPVVAEVGGVEVAGTPVVGVRLVEVPCPAVTVEPAPVAPVAPVTDADVPGPAALAEPAEPAVGAVDEGAGGPVDAERVATVAREPPQAAPAPSTEQASSTEQVSRRPGPAHRFRSTGAIVARRRAQVGSGTCRWQATNPDASVRVRG
jgi:hypothetical protein